MDLSVAAIMLVVLSPLLLLVAVLVKLTSRGPVFFSQERVGMNKRRFKMYKFRSMVMDAEARKEELAHLNEMGVSPEYDPYKYNSFTVNAGNLACELTGVNREKIARLSAANSLGDFPRVLAFQSAVDATVSAPALVDHLFAQLPERDHELVVFDLNRLAEIESLLKNDPKDSLPAILENPDRKFTFSVLTNEGATEESVAVRSWAPGQSSQWTESETGLKWPNDIYSLSHVALPFSGKDPLNGGDQPGPSPGVYLGNLALHGEKATLRIRATDLLRLRWNPFYPYLEQRIVEHLNLDATRSPTEP